MRNETLSNNQMISVLILFLFGSSVAIGVNTAAEQDSWIVVIIACLFAIPLMLLYSRIIKLNPGRDFFEMSTAVLGKVFGIILNILMILYGLHLGAIVLRDFSSFIELTSMPETPELPLIVGLLILTAYIAKCGLETLGSFSVFTLILVMLIFLFTIALSFEVLDMENFYPVDHGFWFMAEKATHTTAFPFGETVLVLGIAGALRKPVRPYKVYIWGTAIGFIVLLLVVIRNTAVLGPHIMSGSNFPSYTAACIMKAGTFLERIESSITYNFLLAGTIKISICLFAATKGIAYLFGIKQYKHIVMPTALLMLSVSAFVFSSTFEIAYFNNFYRFYAIPFQLLIPLAIWIGSEIKNRRATVNSPKNA